MYTQRWGLEPANFERASQGIDLESQTERETLGEMQETLSMGFVSTEVIIGTRGGSLPQCDTMPGAYQNGILW